MVGRAAGGLSRGRARWESLHRKQKSGRYREFVRHVSWEYFSGFADLAVRDQNGTSRNLGSGNRMGKCFPLRVERASGRRRERNPRTQRGDEGSAADAANVQRSTPNIQRRIEQGSGIVSRLRWRFPKQTPLTSNRS